MNEPTLTKTFSDNLQLVAVVFCDLDQKTMELKLQEKPYFYLDVLGCVKGDIAIVHNGTDFGVVTIVRVLKDEERTNALNYVKKPILARVLYNPDDVKHVKSKLAEFSNETKELRIEENIKKELGLKEGGVIEQALPPKTRKARSTIDRYGEMYREDE